ncbi:hypothetical protein DOK78_001380 [Enterococcus sp. DIV2402]|uniref:Uncharacterized protein n=2 Tax=Candidatus Enterococcus lowellii TaxID=2230877 RepID=A0ABZ2SS67_9ENTE
MSWSLFEGKIKMKIKRSQTCHNSPKNQFIEEFSLALLQQNTQALAVTKDWQLIIVGGKQIPPQIEAITIIASISHGRYGSCMGEVTVDDELYHFAIHYEFLSTTKQIIHQAKLLFVKE